MARHLRRFARQFCAARGVPSNSRRRSRLVVQTLEDRTTPATFVVTSAADSGTGTLRDAINFANGSAGPDTITFDTAGTFATPQTIDLLTALPNISNELTIQGPGATNLTVQRDPGAPAFRIITFGGTKLNLSGFTITGGQVVNDDGGAILAGGTVVLDSMVLTGNQATTGGDGGAIRMNFNGDLIVRNSTITGNTAAKSGGGIYFYYNGSLQVINSTISGNTANGSNLRDGGGGIYFFGFVSSTITILNSTIANNTTAGSGGGFVGEAMSGPVFVQNSTITGNVSTTTAAYYGGGGISDPFATGTITVQNSIVSGNTASNARHGPDIYSYAGGTVEVDYSAIGDPTDGFTLAGAHNLTGSPATLGLGSLTNNGGPTLTETPAPGSPLIDAGSNALLPSGTTNDQRGFGYRRTFNGTVDIGAVEFQPLGLPFALDSTTLLTTPGGSTYDFTVTYWDPTGTNNGISFNSVNNNLAAIIVKDPGGNPVPVGIVNITPQADGTPMVVTYEITAPGGVWDGTNDGVYSVQVGTNQVKDRDGNVVPNDVLDPIDIFVPRTLTVTSTADSGPGTLRDVLADANSIGSADTIVFDPTVFNTPQTIALQSALPAIPADGGDLTIDGPGAGLLTVDGGGQFQVFYSQAPDITLFGFTVTGGLASNDIGGGLKSTGNVTVDHMVFSGNVATGAAPFNQGGGGAIGLVVGEGLLEVLDSTISGNTADFNGGGIFLRYSLYGSLLVENSTVSGNATINTSSAETYAGGGGIFIAGIANQAPPPDFVPNAFTIRNSTIANNSTTGSGGGLFAGYTFGGILIQDSTISGNSALLTGQSTNYPDTLLGGGGLAAFATPNLVANQNPTFVLANSVVSGNTNVGGEPDISAANPVYMYYSLVGDATGFTLSPGSSGNLAAGTDPMLGPLQDNGGPTQTMAPLAGSPLLDAGNNGFTYGQATDQRGLNRFDPATGLVDIGALEAQAATVTIAPAAGQANPTNNNTAVNFTVVFDQPVTGFDGSGIDLSASTATGPLTANVTAVSSTVYAVTVTGITGDGDVVASVLSGTATVGVNGSGQPNLPSPTAASVTVDTTAPTVTINVASGQNDPTNSQPIRFDVQFSEAVTGFDASDVVLSSSIGDTLSPIVVPGIPPNSYQVIVFGMTDSSLVTASIPAGAAVDLAGNSSLASTSTDNTIDYDITPPTVTINQGATQGDPGGGLSVSFDAVFSEPVSGFDGSKVDLSASTAPGTLVATVTGTGPSYTVTVTGMTGGGTVVASIDGAVVTDLAGNPNLPSTSTDNSVTYVHSGVIHLSAASYSVSEAGAPQLTITVQRTDGSDGALDIHYATADGSALAGTDYTAVAGNLHWDAGDTADKTFTVQILDDGGFEADSNFTVNLSNIVNVTLPGALGTPATATVNINEEAVLAFSSPTFNTAESDTGADVVAHVTVSRLFGGHGAVSVDYSITGGTATAGADYSAAATGTLTWADGDTADKTIDVTIHDDTFSEGKETINFALGNPSANAFLGTPATTALTIAKSDGITILGSAKVPQVTVSEPDGDLVTLKLGGRVGSLTYYLTNGAGPISEIDLTGTDPTKSTLSITVKKPRHGTGDGLTAIGEIDGIGNAGLKSLSMSKADLVGAGLNFNGYVGSVNLGNVRNGADITLNGTASTPRGVPKSTRITAGQILGDGATGLTDITVAAPLASLTAISIGEGTIAAPSVGSITVKGKKATKTTPGISGDFKSDLTISGAGVDPVKGKALKSLKVAGSVIGSTISVGGSVGLVSVGSFVNSDLFAGFAPSGANPFAGTFSGAFSVGPFLVKATTGGFENSYVVATSIKNVTLASAVTDNSGTPFGFEFHGSAGGTFGGLTVKNPKLTYNKKTGGTQMLQGDLEVLKS
jgi:parallel beta-helix repeat protein